MRVFKHPEFALAAVLSSAVNLAMIGVEMLLPTYIQTIRGETAFHSGLMLLPGALMMGFMQPITGRLFDKYGARRLAIVGLTMLLIGTVPFMTLTDKTPVLSIIIFYAIRLFGVSMVFMPVTTSGMNVLPIAEMSHGTAVNNTFRQTMSSIGTAIMTTVLTNVQDATKPAHSLLTSAPLVYKGHAINAALNGFRAAFGVSAIFAVAALVLAFFLKKENTVRSIDVTDLPKED